MRHFSILKSNREEEQQEEKLLTTIEEVSLDSPIEEKITWAMCRYREIGDLLRRDKMTAVLLAELKDAIYESRAAMAQSGVIDACKDCDENDGGSCCGIGMETKYSGILLLINLLLGQQLPARRDDASSCFFLGKKGCRLLARQVICVNYLCKKITDGIHPQKFAALREKEGYELERLFLLNERIKKICEGASRG